MAYALKSDADDIRNGRVERRLPAIPLDAWAFRRMAPQGSVVSNGLVSADVDGDGVEEVIIGTTEGQLLLLKMGYRTPVYSRTIPATISVVLYSVEMRRLLLVTLEGQCEVIEGFIAGGKSASGTYRGAATPSAPKRDEEGMTTAVGVDANAGGSGNRIRGECLDKEYRPSGPSYIFSIPPNCICGDIGSGVRDNGGNVVFLGSYDGYVYVYSISPVGERFGLLFLHSHVSSMKSFVLPTYEAVSPSAGRFPATYGENRAAASSYSTPETVSGNSLLLVCCSQRIVLLRASREDFLQWQGRRQPRTVSVVGQTRGVQVATPHVPLIETVGSLKMGMEIFLSDDGTSTNKTASLEPMWQFPLYHVPRVNADLPVEASTSVPCPREGVGDLRTQWVPTWQYSWRHSDTIGAAVSADRQWYRHSHQHQLDSSANASPAHERVVPSSQGTDIDLIIRSPAAVDVAVAKHAAQFAVATEDGRWFIFEMPLSSPYGKSPTTDHLGGRSVEGPALSFGITVVCLMSGCVRGDGLVRCVRVFRVGSDEFRTILLALDGTCYVLDTDRNTLITSRVKADALSFTVMGCTPTAKGALVPLYGFSVSRQHEERIGSDSTLCQFALVSVAVDEVVVLSIGCDSHVWSPQWSVRQLSPVHRPLAHHFTDKCTNLTRCHAHEADEKLCEKPASHEESDSLDENALLLELGTLLVGGKGNVDGGGVSEEYRRFVARKFCAFGFTQKEWQQLLRLDESLKRSA